MSCETREQREARGEIIRARWMDGTYGDEGDEEEGDEGEDEETDEETRLMREKTKIWMKQQQEMKDKAARERASRP